VLLVMPLHPLSSYLACHGQRLPLLATGHVVPLLVLLHCYRCCSV
jgi:hypothetical protein